MILALIITWIVSALIFAVSLGFVASKSRPPLDDREVKGPNGCASKQSHGRNSPVLENGLN
jgi:hypothetical protein